MAKPKRRQSLRKNTKIKPPATIELAKLDKTSPTTDDQPTNPSLHDTPSPTDDEPTNLVVNTMSPTPNPDPLPLTSDTTETRTRHNFNSSSTDGSPLPSAFSDRTEHTCTTDKASNTTSGTFLPTNGPTRKPRSELQPPTVTPPEHTSDDDKAQRSPTPSKLFDTHSSCTSSSESSESDSDSEASSHREPACTQPGLHPETTQSLETVTRREFNDMQKSVKKRKRGLSKV